MNGLISRLNKTPRHLFSLFMYGKAVVWKLFDRKCSIDNKLQGKIFLWIHDFLEILYLEHILLVIIHDCSRYCNGVTDKSKNH